MKSKVANKQHENHFKSHQHFNPKLELLVKLQTSDDDTSFKATSICNFSVDPDFNDL